MRYAIITTYTFIIERYLRKYFLGLKLNCLHNILYTRFSTLTEELRDSENFIIETLNTSLIRSEMDLKQNLHAAYLSCLEMHVTVSCLI